MKLCLSIVIPLAKYEEITKNFCQCLNYFPIQTEFIFIREKIIDMNTINLNDSFTIKQIQLPNSTRAKALNQGAKQATNPFIIFLHCDCQLTKQAIDKLIQNLKKFPEKLHCFKLKFFNHSFLKLSKINAFLANLRTKFLGLPFGDQAFCLNQKNFKLLKGFCEKTKYGEDHIFIWKAKHKKIKLNIINDYILTSAKKYKKNGWLRTSIFHQTIWIPQAIIQFIKLLKVKFFK